MDPRFALDRDAILMKPKKGASYGSYLPTVVKPPNSPNKNTVPETPVGRLTANTFCSQAACLWIQKKTKKGR